MPIADLAIMVLLLAPLLVLSGLISGSETALFGLTYADRARLAKDRPNAARAANVLLERPRPLLTALLACNIVVNITYFSISSVLVVRLEENSRPAIAAAVAVCSVVMIILIGEIGAKLIATSQRQRFAALVARAWVAIMRVGWPFWEWLERGLISPLMRLVSSSGASSQTPGASTEALATVLASHAEDVDAHANPEDQARLLRILEIGQTRAREAMRPRSAVVTCSLDARPDALLDALQDAEELLITDPGEDTPAGWLPASAAVMHALGEGSSQRRGLLRPLVYVPEQATLDAALTQIGGGSVGRALVVDELGAYVGVLGLDDIAARLLAEPVGPVGHAVEQPRLVGLGCFEIPGDWPARGLLTDLDIPHPEAERLLARVSTVGGLMLAMLGRIPSEGDTVSLPGATMRVERIDGRVITTLVVAFEAVSGLSEEVRDR
ncbi:MAG: CNNM domain-containing protein [Planctomycetota bacterium]